MKVLLVLSVVVFVTVAAHVANLTEEQLAKIKVIKDQCIPETGVTSDIYDKIIAGDFSNTEKSTKCFVKCFYQKAGFFDKDDNLDVEVTIAKISADYGAENAEKWITPCKDIQNEDPCDKAFEVAQCFYKAKNPSPK